MRVLATKNFMRFARSFGTTADAIWNVVHAAPDADLGGGVFKFRLARSGEGKSGGARAIVAMKINERVVLMYGFEKKDLANIRRDQLNGFQALAKHYCNLSEKEVDVLVTRRTLSEIRSKTGGHDGEAYSNESED